MKTTGMICGALTIMAFSAQALAVCNGTLTNAAEQFNAATCQLMNFTDNMGSNDGEIFNASQTAVLNLNCHLSHRLFFGPTGAGCTQTPHGGVTSAWVYFQTNSTNPSGAGTCTLFGYRFTSSGTIAQHQISQVALRGVLGVPTRVTLPGDDGNYDDYNLLIECNVSAASATSGGTNLSPGNFIMSYGANWTGLPTRS